MSSTQITVVVPRLWDALRALVASFGPTWPGRAAWERVLGRGSVESCGQSDLERTILAAAGIADDPTRDCPVAAFSRIADGVSVDGGVWMRADPVSLRADRDQLLLVNWDLDDLNAQIAQSLAQRLIPLFDSTGWRLFAPTPQRWYVVAPADLQVRTFAPQPCMGASIQNRLPFGRDAAVLRRLLTEVQMSLHMAPENNTRSEQGLPVVNSVWFWGLGAAPITAPSRFAEHLWSEDALTIGLARAAGVPFDPLPADARALRLSGESWLSVLSIQRAWNQRNVQALSDAVEQFHNQWLAPLLAQLGRKTRLRILADTGVQWATTGKDQRRWWVPRRNLETHCTQLIPEPKRM